MLKRLIEVALPLKEVSEHSAREKSIRHGHISTLHIWWARRPLAACRAVVFASLIPDPDDPQCPESFRQLVTEMLGRNEFRPKNGEGSTVEDTPRNRCLEFIKHLVKWANSNNPTYIEPARKLIAASRKLLEPDAEGEAPKVLDPFAGGGAIPLEALRLGCDALAIDLNPVAHLIELCTLVYPQKYGQPDSRPVPEYIKRLVARNKATRKARGQGDLFDGEQAAPPGESHDLISDVRITEAEYRRNPLATDVKYWGLWLLERSWEEMNRFYPADADGNVPVAYLWARTVACPNPTCGLTIPLVRQLWLCKKANRKVALRLVPDGNGKVCRFEVVEGNAINFDPEQGTMKQGKASCPKCGAIVDGTMLRTESKAKRMGQQIMAVVLAKGGKGDKTYRTGNIADAEAYLEASRALAQAVEAEGKDIVPSEAIPCYDPRRVSPPLYGLTQFSDLFNDRELLCLTRYSKWLRAGLDELHKHHEADYCRGVNAMLSLVIDWVADKQSTLTHWHTRDREKISGTFSRQALGMAWDYVEPNSLCESSGGLLSSLDWNARVLEGISFKGRSPIVKLASANQLPVEAGQLDAVVTDPPYYDAIPYSVLSDYFYVWLKRTAKPAFPDVFRTPLSPKTAEAIEQRPHKLLSQRKDRAFYENMMFSSFSEMRRIVASGGICCVMFAHKSTSAWESLILGLIRSGLIVTTSWPFHTEMKTRTVARDTAALASSVTLVCRKRAHDAGDGLWDDVRQELKLVAGERLDFFWSQHIRGADFFISAIGPALSVFGRYERVKRLSGEEVTVGQFLDEVRGLVTNYALAKILKTTHTANIDSESRFYVFWKWSYGDAKVPADEAFKLAQALGMNTEIMWDRTGVLEKAGENVQAVPVAKRMKIKGLGEPDSNSAPASLIDVLHRMCVFREKGDTAGMTEFLTRSGQAQNPALWLVAQAVSEILSDGDKEKQLMQGLLNQKEQLAEAQGRLF
jgi:adenine-specific DNA methylase